MEKKKARKSWYDIFSDFIEVYIPCAVFIFLFITYAILIFYRYVMRSSINWMYELNTFAFVWAGVLAASCGSRKVSHVQFTILYDHVSEGWQRAMRMIGNLAVVALFAVIFPMAVKNLKFLAVRKSSILKVTFDYVYAPFLVYMALTAVHHAVHLVRDVVGLLKHGKEAAE